MEKLIHTPEGSLISDKPWYFVEGQKGKVVDEEPLIPDVGGHVKCGQIVLITKEAIKQTELYIEEYGEIYFTFPESNYPKNLYVTGTPEAIEPIYD